MKLLAATGLALVLLLLCVGIRAAPTETKLTAFGLTQNDRLGFDLDVDADTLVAGAHNWGSSTPGPGAAVVYVRGAGGWTEQDRFSFDFATSGAAFGYGVAVAGDTIAVGAPWWSSYRGRAYVFTRTGTDWDQTDELDPLDPATNKHFGTEVEIGGGGIVVGAHSDDEVADGAGAVYWFTETAGDWSQQQKLFASDAAEDDAFGVDVAVDGHTMVVGALYRENALGDRQGAAYVFENSGGTWTEVKKLTAGDATLNAEYGRSVAIDGDTIAVGAPRHTVWPIAPGAVYVYERDGGAWTQQKLTASDGKALDWFGYTVDLAGDLLVVGAYTSDTPLRDSGSAYVFRRSGGTWTEITKLTASDGAEDHRFGIGAAVGGNTAFIGADDDVVGDNAGAVYVFEGLVAPTTNTPPEILLGPTAGTDLAAVGESVPFTVTAQDLDGDPLTYAWDFGDGGVGAGRTPTHTFAAPGLYTVSVTVDDGTDTDTGQTEVRVGHPFDDARIQAKINWKKDPKDSLKLKGWLPIPEDFRPGSQTFFVDAGGVQMTYVLDDRGRAKTDTGKVKLKYSRKKGAWRVTLKEKKGSFAASWADEGLIDGTAKKAPVSIRVRIDVAGMICTHGFAAAWTCRAGRSGRAR